MLCCICSVFILITIIDNAVRDSIKHTKVYTHMLCTLTRSLTPPCRHDPLFILNFRATCLSVCVCVHARMAYQQSSHQPTNTHSHTRTRQAESAARVRARKATVWILSGAQVRTSLGAVQSSPQQRRASTRSRHARTLATLALQPRTAAIVTA